MKEKKTTNLAPAEQELHILGRETLHSSIIRIDSRVDHVGFLLLQQNHSALNGVFNAESGNGARTSLANAMAAVRRLPFRSWVPPWIDNEDLGGFSQVESNTTGFEGDEEAFNVDVSHEVVDGGLALGGGH